MVLGCALAGAPASAGAQVPEVAEAPAPAAPYREAVDSARSILRTLMAVEAIPGLSVAVGRGGRILWSEGFGWADLEHGVPVTPLTRFRVGSVSKPITAAALLLLVEEGRVELDAPVRRYVAEFPEKRWTVTPRQLGGHVAGVRHYRDDEFLNSERYGSVTEGLRIFARDTLLFAPGTDYSYSSYGWNLLSAVVERASGEAFLPHMRRRVFEPLGMRGTVAGHTDSIIAHRTGYYRRSDDWRVLNAEFVDNSYKWAGGGFLSTAEDLVRFGAAHLEPGFLHPESLERLFTSQVLSNGDKTGYGIGWRVDTNARGEELVHHTGGSVGGRTVLWIDRDRGMVVAALANLSEAPIEPELAEAIAELFLVAGADASTRGAGPGW